MEAVFTTETKTGDIVTRFPNASQYLKKYKIDFCCGGNRPIGEALQEKKLNAVEFLDTLNDMYRKVVHTTDEDTDWTKAPYHELIDHIINKHHKFLSDLLPELSAFVTKVYRVHGKKHPELASVYKLFHNLKVELEEHMIHEEEDFFPQINAYSFDRQTEKLPEILNANFLLEKEHETAGLYLKELRECTADYKLPDDACMTYQVMYLKLQELEEDLFQHIHLENNILFPRLEAEMLAEE
ncbi:iron-sulfur cluster repair di-iron protein [Pseudalkalibacillus sp. R45]|uniref:iron-sulfur cluster repair di-iron protein n=1 Tax=Pseudalkalibacillus sp. R45 TaxID=3457433 RepID=UPI003FCE9BFE